MGAKQNHGGKLCNLPSVVTLRSGPFLQDTGGEINSLEYYTWQQGGLYMYKRKIPKTFPGSKVMLKPALCRTAPKTELMVSKERLSSPLRCRISSIAGISLVLITPEFYTKLTTCIEILTVSTAWDSTQVDKLQLSTPLASRTKPRSYFYKPGSLLQQTVI